MDVKAPKYHLVKERIVELIADSPPGTPLATERELATRFATSRTTVRQALAALAADGRLERTQGSGTFVAEPKRVLVRQLTSYSEDLSAQGWRPSSRLVGVSRERAGAQVGAALGVDPGDLVNRVERIRFVDDEPLALEIAHLPGRLPRLRQQLERTGSLYETLREAYGVRLVRAEDMVETALASPLEAQRLDVDSGVPMLVIHRTAWDGDGRPVEFTRSVFRGDRFRFIAQSSVPAG